VCDVRPSANHQVHDGPKEFGVSVFVQGWTGSPGLGKGEAMVHLKWSGVGLDVFLPKTFLRMTCT